MKINTYHNNLNYDLYGFNMLKYAGISSIDEVAEGLSNVFRLSDEIATAVPSVSRAVQELQESITSSKSVLDEIYGNAYVNAIELGKLSTALDEVSTLDELDELYRAVDAQAALSDSIIARTQFDKAKIEGGKDDLLEQLKKATDDKQIDSLKIQELTDAVALISKESDEMTVQMVRAKAAAENLTKQVAETKEALLAAQTSATSSDKLVEILGKNNSELVARLRINLSEQAALESRLMSGTLTEAEKTTALKELQTNRANTEQIIKAVSDVDPVRAAALKTETVKIVQTKSGPAANSDSGVPDNIPAGTKPAKGPVADSAATNRAEPVGNNTAGTDFTVGKGSYTKTPASNPEQAKQLADLQNEQMQLEAKAKIKELNKGTIRKWLDTKKNVGLDLAGKVAWTGAKVVTVLGIIAVGGYALYSYITDWWTTTGEIADLKLQGNDVDESIDKVFTLLSRVQFNESESKQITDTYLSLLKNSRGSGKIATDPTNDEAAISQALKNLSNVGLTSVKYLEEQSTHQSNLRSNQAWPESLKAIRELSNKIIAIATKFDKGMESIHNSDLKISEEQAPSEQPNSSKPRNLPPKDPNDEGLEILGQKIYLSQYPEIDYATRSAIPVLTENVLLTPTGLAFWDPENKMGGGYIKKPGDLASQIIKHVRFFLNPKTLDRNWAYGPIRNERQLKRFMRKNLPKDSRTHDSSYKTLRREYRNKKPNLSEAYIINPDNFNKRAIFLDQLNNSININSKAVKNIVKYADPHSKEYYQGALKDLDDSYAKTYYAGLKRMYEEKLGERPADYKTLYEPHGTNGVEILEQAHPLSITVAPSMGRGGLVENLLEQQRHNVGVALSIPTGNYRGKYAKLAESLKKVAAIAKESNETEACNSIENIISDIDSILNDSQNRK